MLATSCKHAPTLLFKSIFKLWDATLLIDWEEGGYFTTDVPMPRGEIVVGGANVTLGYFKRKDKTNEVYMVDEKGTRWFYTGDIGRFHPDGCLEIIDRKKDIVKLQNGKYVPLGKVEAALIVSHYVDNIMLHADPFHNYCVALVVPSRQTLQIWAQKEGFIYDDFEDLCLKKEAIQEVYTSLLKASKFCKLNTSTHLMKLVWVQRKKERNIEPSFIVARNRMQDVFKPPPN
eukprot:Gb_21772 [translate_table: standard]